MKSLYLKILSLLLIFCGLVYFNYFKAQNAIKNTRETVLSIEIKQPSSQSYRTNLPIEFTWNIEAPSDFQTNYTTLYYDFYSTPSALTRNDSPDAVGYHYKTSDYLNGRFFLPSTFSSTVSFAKPTRVWFRAYSNIRGNHLWTEEKYLDITP